MFLSAMIQACYDCGLSLNVMCESSHHGGDLVSLPPHGV